MLARVSSCAVIGLDGVVVEVGVDYTSGFPGITIVGLPDAAIQESRELVSRCDQRTPHPALPEGGMPIGSARRIFLCYWKSLLDELDQPISTSEAISG
jgi:hypothetical protein